MSKTESRVGWLAAGRALKIAREASGKRLVDVAPTRDASWMSRVESGTLRPVAVEIHAMADRLGLDDGTRGYLLFQWWGVELPPMPARGTVKQCPRHGGYIHECVYCAHERMPSPDTSRTGADNPADESVMCDQGAENEFLFNAWNPKEPS